MTENEQLDYQLATSIVAARMRRMLLAAAKKAETGPFGNDYREGRMIGIADAYRFVADHMMGWLAEGKMPDVKVLVDINYASAYTGNHDE